MITPAPLDADRQRVAAEVLELGEALFDTVIEEMSLRSQDSGKNSNAVSLDDARAAVETFFAALRLLFGFSENPTGPSDRPISGNLREAQA